MLTFTPRRVSSSIAGRPAAVPGTLIITFGWASRCHRSVAWAIVACVSSARSGVHSNEMNPSVPRLCSWAGRSSRAAARMSSSASEKNSSRGSRSPPAASCRSWPS